MGRSTLSSRSKVKEMEDEIFSMSISMKGDDIKILRNILSLAEKHSNEISDYNQFFAAILIEIYKMKRNEDADKRNWF
ncbi:MAG: hypothetical protein QXZ44_07110 [Ferroplasma sp.]